LGIDASYETDQFETEAAVARSLASTISSLGPSIAPAAIFELLENTLYSHETIYGSCIAFEPDSYPCDAVNLTSCSFPGLNKGVPSASGIDDDGNSTWTGADEPWTIPAIDLWEGQSAILYAPYTYRGGDWAEGDAFNFLDLADGYNYWEGTTEWYHSPRSQFLYEMIEFSEGTWSEPYFDEGAGNIEMVTFSVPFWRTAEVPVKSHPDAADETVFPYGLPDNAARLDWLGRPKWFGGIATIDLVLSALTFDCGDLQIYDSDLKACRSCIAGTQRVEASDGTVSCEKCEAGEYSLGQNDSCTSCPLGYFQAETGASHCNACADGMTTGQLQMVRGSMTLLEFTGSTSSTDCACIEGSTSYQSNDTCESCGEGMSCPGGSYYKVEAGYWSPALHPLSIFECADEEACPGGEPGSCTAMHSNDTLACSSCESGYRSTGNGRCESCAGLDFLLMPATALLVLAFLAGIYFLAVTQRRAKQARSSVLAALAIGQVLTMLQQLSVMDAMLVAWPTPLSGLVSSMSVLSFDIEVLQTNCFMGLAATVSYSTRVFSVLALFCILIVIHVLVVLVRYQGRFWEKRSFMYGSSGTLFITLLVPILTALVAPLRCEEHPNGLSTVQGYPSVVCWSDAFDSPHSGMVVMSLCSCVLPAAVMAGVLYAVFLFPSKLRKGDTSFLQSTMFLFFRFRSEAHWYIVVFVVRNALISLVPVIPDAAAQIQIMFFILTVSMILTVYVWPWRVAEANALDVGCCFGLTVMLTCAAFFVGDVSAQTWAIFCLVLVSTLLLIVFSVFSLAIHQRMKNRILTKKFKFFISHHKEASGNFARLLKLHLMDNQKVHHHLSGRQVFLDSDGLSDLAALYDTVRCHTDTLLVLCTRSLFERPWCIGETTMAALHGIKRVGFVFEDFAIPDAHFISKFEHRIEDWSPLAEHGITLDAVKDMLAGFMSWPQVVVPSRIDDETVLQMVDFLFDKSIMMSYTSLFLEAPSTVSGELMGHGSKKKNNLDNSPDEVVGSCGFVGLDDVEAFSALLVIKRLLPPIVGKMQLNIVEIEGPLSPSTTAVVLVCSNGMFASSWILETLIAARDLGAVVVPVTIQSNFRFPTSNLESVLKEISINVDLSKVEVANLLREVFKSISIGINVQDSMDVLQGSVEQLRRRLEGEESTSRDFSQSGTLTLRKEANSNMNHWINDEEATAAKSSHSLPASVQSSAGNTNPFAEDVADTIYGSRKFVVDMTAGTTTTFTSFKDSVGIMRV